MGVKQIINPYRFPGTYHKAQLHLHTSESIDVRKKIPVAETVLLYKEAGYTFIVITDHDRVTRFTDFNGADFLVIPGIEETIIAGFWPLGKHLIRIGTNDITPSKMEKTASIPAGSLFAPAHPNWPGNCWTGLWRKNDLKRLPGLRLIEIFNRHSSTVKDVALWHQLLVSCEPQQPVWGIAVDDTDNASPLDLGWIMIKTSEITQNDFTDALYRGSFYATCGPHAEFDVQDGTIFASTPDDATIRFINNSSDTVLEVKARSARYRPDPADRFIRIEIENNHNKTAWSQPFFVVS